MSDPLAGELDFVRSGARTLPLLTAPTPLPALSSDSPSDADDEALTADRLRLLATLMGASSSSSDGAAIFAFDADSLIVIDGLEAELDGAANGGGDARTFLAGDERAFGSSSAAMVRHYRAHQPLNGQISSESNVLPLAAEYLEDEATEPSSTAIASPSGSTARAVRLES